MLVKLYYNNSANNKIGKSLNSETSFEGSLRDSSKVVNPKILIESSTPLNYNYAYIPAFNRYYYITEIESYRTNLWLVSLRVDVLESYKTDIRNMICIIEATEDYKGNPYLSNSESWVSTVKTKTDIITFPNGLLDNGEYILITAGGGVVQP